MNTLTDSDRDLLAAVVDYFRKSEHEEADAARELLRRLGARELAAAAVPAPAAREPGDDWGSQ